MKYFRPGLYLLLLATAAWRIVDISIAERKIVLLDNNNRAAKMNQPGMETTLSLKRTCLITLVKTTHFNDGRGAKPGSLGLRDASGRLHGPWPARGEGEEGIRYLYWIAEPMVVLPPGEYTVVDSEPATWSHNAQSRHQGMTRIKGTLMDEPAAAAGDAKR